MLFCHINSIILITLKYLQQHVYESVMHNMDGQQKMRQILKTFNLIAWMYKMKLLFPLHGFGMQLLL